jgi:hypothetical protein
MAWRVIPRSRMATMGAASCGRVCSRDGRLTAFPWARNIDSALRVRSLMMPPFPFGHGGEHLDDHAAAWGRGVNVRVESDQADLASGSPIE